MSSHVTFALFASCLALGTISPASGRSPPPRLGTPPQTEPARTDRYGDLLPDWAVARLRATRTRQGRSVRSISFSPDGQTVVLASWVQPFEQWDLATGRELGRFQGHPGGTTVAVFSPDG